MSLYNGNKSRAPLIPLRDEEKSKDGELLVKRDDAGVHLLVVGEDGDGNRVSEDLIKTAVDPIKKELKETTQVKVDPDEPVNTHEQLWVKCETYDNKEGTMKNIADYGPDEEIDQL